MSQLDTIEDLKTAERTELIDAIDALGLTVKKSLSTDNMRAAIIDAITNGDDAAPAKAVEPEAPRAEQKQLGKTVRGVIINVANVSSGSINYQVASARVELEGAGLISVLTTGKKHGDIIQVPVI